MTLSERIWKEFKNPDTQRGLWLGIIASYFYVMFFGQSDTSLLSDIQNGVLPYGWLWTIFNPLYWTQRPYIVINMLECLAVLGVQYYLVKKGRVNKWIMMMNSFQIVFFSATHVIQENTVIFLGPFIAAGSSIWYPIIFIGLMVLQKLPIGWSLSLSDPHVQCGIWGKCFYFYNSRLDIARSDFFTHLALIFWVIAPLMLWYKRRTGRMPFRGQLEWMERHQKIMFIGWLSFMIGLTIYAVFRNGGAFWNYCVGGNWNGSTCVTP